ncbi:hypothetical protein H9L39_00942 [Fusarium oxysporum f. sp. albedinis]|nr:hypothetical protein H9L39_00942 [Fusarium oxysporum f. sp. albedinis]
MSNYSCFYTQNRVRDPFTLTQDVLATCTDLRIQADIATISTNGCFDACRIKTITNEAREASALPTQNR